MQIIPARRSGQVEKKKTKLALLIWVICRWVRPKCWAEYLQWGSLWLFSTSLPGVLWFPIAKHTSFPAHFILFFPKQCLRNRKRVSLVLLPPRLLGFWLSSHSVRLLWLGGPSQLLCVIGSFGFVLTISRTPSTVSPQFFCPFPGKIEMVSA